MCIKGECRAIMAVEKRERVAKTELSSQVEVRPRNGLERPSGSRVSEASNSFLFTWVGSKFWASRYKVELRTRLGAIPVPYASRFLLGLLLPSLFLHIYSSSFVFLFRCLFVCLSGSVSDLSTPFFLCPCF